ncbi:hypothetical protein M3Y96_00970100 [Aphelenchoides besseyi]|nr:hypothetical protein M3Y96_00970100 [Aphelenchoides besseyi]
MFRLFVVLLPLTINRIRACEHIDNDGSCIESTDRPVLTSEIYLLVVMVLCVVCSPFISSSVGGSICAFVRAPERDSAGRELKLSEETFEAFLVVKKRTTAGAEMELNEEIAETYSLFDITI